MGEAWVAGHDRTRAKDCRSPHGTDRLVAGRRRYRGHELPAVAAAPAGDALPAAVAHPLRAAVSVLLDGADVDQAGRPAARSRHLQSVLDLESDAQARLQAPVRDRLPGLALEHDAGCRV